MSTANNWHWLAGFWDGEGSCGFYKYMVRGYKSGHLIAQIAQKELYPLRRVKKISGVGTIRRYRDSHGNWHYKWTVTSRKAAKFLSVLKEFTGSPRRLKQIKVALQKDKLKVNPQHFNYGKTHSIRSGIIY